jgi:hypothetical protein
VIARAASIPGWRSLAVGRASPNPTTLGRATARSPC